MAVAVQSGLGLAAGPAALAVRRLVLTDFRNYRSLRLEVSEGPVVLAGDNGAGKTNLLEAVSLLTPGRGLRHARAVDLARQGGPGGWAVAASVASTVGPVELGSGCPAGADRRTVRINGAPAGAQADLGDYLSAVWLTPAMNQLFGDGAAGRRRFLDRLVVAFDPAHSGRIWSYEQALRQRARLLKERGANSRADAAWLDALEAQIAARGVSIAAARLDLVDRLARVAAEGFGPFPGAHVAVEGDVEAALRQSSAVQAEDRFREALAAARPEDSVAGGAATGPHRSDLSVRHIAKGLPAERCSTGEQKALLVALVLAHARLTASERGAAPILLLDEVAAHLDEGRRAALFEAVLGLGCQAWMTGTDAAVFGALAGRVQRLRVADAVVTPDDGPAG